MDIWFYVDNGRNRQGPVTAEAVAAAFQAGQVNDESLVWREGLAQWAPLRQFRDELGMGPAMAPAAIASTAAAAPAPAAEDKKKNGCLLAALIIGGVGLALVVLLAIVAAIAMPAYQDYLTRAKLTQGLAEADAVKWQVEEFIAEQGRCPNALDDLGLDPPTSEVLAAVDLVSLGEGRCVIELTLAPLPKAEALADARIYLSRDEDGDWTCSSDLADTQALPARCR